MKPNKLNQKVPLLKFPNNLVVQLEQLVVWQENLLIKLDMLFKIKKMKFMKVKSVTMLKPSGIQLNKKQLKLIKNFPKP